VGAGPSLLVGCKLPKTGGKTFEEKGAFSMGQGNATNWEAWSGGIVLLVKWRLSVFPGKALGVGPYRGASAWNSDAEEKRGQYFWGSRQEKGGGGGKGRRGESQQDSDGNLSGLINSSALAAGRLSTFGTTISAREAWVKGKGKSSRNLPHTDHRFRGHSDIKREDRRGLGRKVGQEGVLFKQGLR